MAKKKTSKPEVVTPSEMVAFTESLKKDRPAARKKAKKKAASRAVRPGRTDDPRQMQLPGLSDSVLAMPNHVARSSLFVPVARGRRKMQKDAVLESRGDAVFSFSGEQLDESDADVWMLIMKIAGEHPPGAVIEIHRAEFLRSLDRDCGGKQYEWLHKSLKRLDFGQLSIESSTGGKAWRVGVSKILHPISEFGFQANAGVYTLRVDPRWTLIYGGNQFALIDWEKRLLFGKNQDMAKSLQRLIATSSDSVQRYQVEWLKRRMAFAGRLRDFRKALRAAFVELERVGVIREGKLVGEIASWRRVRERLS